MMVKADQLAAEAKANLDYESIWSSSLHVSSRIVVTGCRRLKIYPKTSTRQLDDLQQRRHLPDDRRPLTRFQ